MHWFKLLWLNSKEREILKKAEENEKNNLNISSEVKKEDSSVNTNSLSIKPYHNIIYDGNVIQVVFHDGSLYSKSNIDHNTFLKVRNANSEEEIDKLLNICETKRDNDQIEKEEDKLVNENLHVFNNHPDFERIDENLFMKGVGLRLPPVVIAGFIEILEKISATKKGTLEMKELEENYNALKMFWLQLALNPLKQSREDLLLFVRRNDVHITKNGNLILYRRIVSCKETIKELNSFISQSYFERKKQKKSHTNPKNYSVFRLASDGSFVLWNGSDTKPDGELIGNLEKLYKSLPEQEGNVYTSWHNKGELEIKIGGVYKIPDNKINLDNTLCSAGGLHAAAVDYDYEGFGDTPVVVLVNPSKAITVPRNEWKKLRTTEMFIATINDKPHGVHYDEGDLSVFDEEYYNISMQELENAFSKKDFSALFIDGNPPEITISNIKVISEMMKNRVKSIL